MILLANCQNIASTGNQNYSRTQGSGMTFFHTTGHKCGICFKSGRVGGLEGINTEICEQVNDFLQ